MTVYLNDVGIVCSLGASKTSVYEKFIAGETGLDATKTDYGVETFIGKVNEPLPSLLNFPVTDRSRNNQLSFLAYQQISTQIEELKKQFGDKRIAVVIGTSTSGIASGEESMTEYLNSGQHSADYDYSMQEMGATAKFIAKLSGAKGYVYSVSTACTSGAKALISGQRLLDSGMANVVIAGGVDSLCKMTINGFKSIESISSSLTKPFQEGRNGINIGEGAALFIMSSVESGVELKGFGESSDGHHISAPHPDGEGAKVAMENALDKAHVVPSDIDYINLHGTGTVQNDSMESIAVYEIFSSTTYCSASKQLHGHCLGAAGAIEAGLCWLLLSSEFNSNGRYPKQKLATNYDSTIRKINLAEDIPDNRDIQFCMSNSYAFGGNNTSLILAKHHV